MTRALLRTLWMALVGLCALISPSGWAADDAVTFQLNPAHTGAINFPDGLTLPLRQIWSVDLSPGRYEAPATVSYTIVAEGKVFVIVRRDHSIVSRAMAFDLATGKELWSVPVHSTTPVGAWATYSDGKLFVLNRDGRLIALNPSTGETLWRKRYVNDFYSFHSPPAAANGLVYISGIPSSPTAQNPPKLIAVDSSDGRVVWTQPVQVGATPALYGNDLLATDACAAYRFNARTGKPVWQWVLPGCSGSLSPISVIYRGYLYTYELHPNPYDFDYVLMFPIDGGRIVDPRIKVIKPPVFNGNIGYFPGHTEVLAFSLTPRRLLWRFSIPESPTAPLLVVNGKLLVVSLWGEMFVLNSVSGKVLQTVVLGSGTNTSSPGIGAGDGTIVLTAGSKLLAFKGAEP